MSHNDRRWERLKNASSNQKDGEIFKVKEEEDPQKEDNPKGKRKKGRPKGSKTRL